MYLNFFSEKVTMPSLTLTWSIVVKFRVKIKIYVLVFYKLQEEDAYLWNQPNVVGQLFKDKILKLNDFRKYKSCTVY